jgi:F-type H+-transporting ATPase subunit delta
MRIPKQARRKAKALFRLCVSNGLLQPDRVRAAVTRILEIKPRGYLAILTHLRRLLQLEEERCLARIQSAAPLAAPMQRAIQSSLERHYGAGLTFQFAQNPELFGGIRIQVGSDVYDNTVSARLGELRDAFDSA